MKRLVKRDWKQPSFDGICPTVVDWAKMAAFIDGEGSVLINTQHMGPKRANTGLYLRVTVANTDVRLMVWLKETFGGTFKDANTAKYYEGKNWKRSYHWGASSQRAAWILHNCLPHFVMKGEQAGIGIRLQESLNWVGRPGRTGLSEEVRDSRKVLKERLLVLKRRGVNPVVTPAIETEKAS